MSTLMQTLNLYATRDSQPKFEANHMKNGKVTVLRLVEEKEEQEEQEEEEEEEEEEICKHGCTFIIYMVKKIGKKLEKENFYPKNSPQGRPHGQPDGRTSGHLTGA